jgi:sensor histidine kinase YesM
MRKEDVHPIYHKLRKWGIPIITLLYALVFDGLSLCTGSLDGSAFLINTFHTFCFVFSIWRGCEFIIIRLDRRMPWEADMRKRLIAQIVLVSVWCSFVIVAGIYILHSIYHFEITQKHILLNLLITNITNIAMNAIIASIHFFKNWKKSLLENEQLKKEQVLSEFAALKSQVNPHFLFNCLNTLTALIEDDPSIATRYVYRMAAVYRYVLTHKDKLVVAVADELKFLEDYIFLNQMRFESNLVVSIEIPEAYLQEGVITLGMQMLVENAIKHNVISKLKPLYISIYATPNYISVKNNLQEKMSENSTGIGLANIQNRYHALTEHMEVEIIRTSEYFEVRLPIIYQKQA